MESRGYLRNKYIPSKYSTGSHILTTCLAPMAALGLGISFLIQREGLDWVKFASCFLLINFSEYLIHRFLLHHNRKFNYDLYFHHSHVHHIMFRDDTMEMEEKEDLYLVLLPPSMLLGLVLVVYPLGGLLFWLLFSLEWGMTYFVCNCFYIMCYELIHLSCHTKKDNPIRKVPILSWIIGGHERHHNLELMSRKNFNVVFPLSDFLFRTLK